MDPSEFSFRTAEPRRYGFHATVVAPFQMNSTQSEETLFAAFDRFCAIQHAFAVSLEVKGILSFVAIMEAVQSRPLNDMAAAAVEFFQPFLSPLTEAEIARRKPEQLTSRQLLLLHRWGYPYVMEEFRFHMTLSNSLESAAHGAMLRAAQERFAPLLAAPVEIGGKIGRVKVVRTHLQEFVALVAHPFAGGRVAFENLPIERMDKQRIFHAVEQRAEPCQL